MGDSGNTTLELLWKSGRVGNLCPLEQLKAVVYREVLLETGTPEHKFNSTIATKLKKLGGGAVTRQAVGQLLAKYDEDAEWYPGKSYQTSFGPAPALNGAKRRCVAQAAMSLKQQDLEPTYALVLAQCPKAALNPNTKKPVDKKVIYEIMRTECYDDDENPDDTWSHRPRLPRTSRTSNRTSDTSKCGTGLTQTGAGRCFRFFRGALFAVSRCPTCPRCAASAFRVHDSVAGPCQ